MPLRRTTYVEAENRIITAKNELRARLDAGDVITMEELMKYCEHQAHNSAPKYDPATVAEAVEAPLLMQPQPRPSFILQQQPIINPNLQQQPFVIAQQHQMLMNQQMQMLQ